ncbi:MAG: 16S rRNA (guanine(966)-N(2))-methyltransferase RsmD [Mycobacteriaceae bacterium]|nr:16S rRNA (guanine(966)-N(2))-methyltransferase RsmD [Mycobacteriaceae bacterium]MBV9641697.1 16S rRNA (guanine(966)-N(2))-methyltransferase RsmD [Mycobacteriaceae bacterium]
MTRIVGGSAGGRRIAVPPRVTRPTSERVREALFNILAARLDLRGRAVLDLYAGSGALGLEALSRGAATATFVEADRRAAAVIRRNIATLAMAGATVLTRRVGTVLDEGSERPADLVLADPPYGIDAAELEQMLAALAGRGWTTAGSVVVVERRSSAPPLSWPEGWTGWPTRRYGDTRLELAEC